MTGYLLTCSGEIWQLPPLLSWKIERTDGDPCDSAEVAFLYEPQRLDVLKKAVRIRLVRDGKTAFFGVVDEVMPSVTAQGKTAALSARSLAALMMDTELRAAAYPVLTEQDAIAQFANSCGVDHFESGNLPPVRDFSVDTGTTCWQALCGFCRHSADIRPRMRADGTLLLKWKRESWLLDEMSGYTALRYRLKRYGVLAEQTVVSGKGAAETVSNAALRAIGIAAKNVTMLQGKKTRARWRSAKQRLDDSARDSAILTVTLPGGFEAEPGDKVKVNLPSAGISGSFLLRSVCDQCAAAERSCTLELEGTLL